MRNLILFGKDVYVNPETVIIYPTLSYDDTTYIQKIINSNPSCTNFKFESGTYHVNDPIVINREKEVHFTGPEEDEALIKIKEVFCESSIPIKVTNLRFQLA